MSRWRACSARFSVVAISHIGSEPPTAANAASNSLVSTLANIARMADETGIDSLFVSDHLVQADARN